MNLIFKKNKMKTVINLFAFILLVSFVGLSQPNLYSVTTNGGANGFGAIYQFDATSGLTTVEHDFTGGVSGGSGFSGVINASNGLFYGARYAGGANGLGVIYSYDPATSIYTDLYSFTATESVSYGNLFEASNGFLYGMSTGGAFGFGTLFKFDLGTNSLTVIHDFDGNDGVVSYESLVEVPGGILYGATSQSISGSPVIFKIDLATETLTIGGSAGSTSFIRVFRAVMKTANTGNTNVGVITITVSSTTVAQIRAGYGQSLMCVYTIPRKYNAYLMQIDLGSSKDLENEIRFISKEIDNGNVWNTKAFITTRGGFVEKNYIVPVKFTEKTDLELVAKASATSSISAGFELILEKVDQS